MINPQKENISLSTKRLFAERGRRGIGEEIDRKPPARGGFRNRGVVLSEGGSSCRK